jgi:hypothetical protein
MGGNALKQGSVRLKRADYERVQRRVMQELLEVPGVVAQYIPYYAEKESFGDLDVLWYRTEGEYPFEDDDFFSSVFQSTEVVRNGKVISFDFHDDDLGLEEVEGRGFQVDLIEVASEDFAFAYGYYSYNDLGNLLGVIAKAHGLKLGHKGLFYRYRHAGTCNTTDILLTKNWHEALDFLGVDSKQAYFGFRTLTEIFEYVNSCQNFDPKLYSLDALNSVNRVRNKKRKTYMEFLDWLSDRYPDPRLVAVSRWNPLGQAFRIFPEFEDRLTRAVQDIVFREKVKEVFNGDIVTEWTGKTGKELGQIMKRLRSWYANDILFQIDALYNREHLRVLAIAEAGDLDEGEVN